MTKIPPSHILADRAVLVVSDILNQAGALAEKIQNDYGEDLLVQSHLDGDADDFRVLVQIKGTNRTRRSNETRTIRLKIEHLRRWVSQIDPILVCLYEHETQKVFAFSPNQRFSLWEMATTKRRSLSITLSETDLFNEQTAKKFLWICRIDHWSRILSWHENHYNEVNESPHFPSRTARSVSKRLRLEMGVIVLNFLKSIGIIQDGKISDDFRKMVKHGSANLSAMNQEDDDEELTLYSVFMLALLGQVDRVCGTGLPDNLMYRGTELCGVFHSGWHVKEWREAKKYFPKCDWQPTRSKVDRKNFKAS